MPQDELWRASARLTGYHIAVAFDVLQRGDDQLIISPRWSKTPAHGREGLAVVKVPLYARDYIPGIIRKAHDEMTGGLAKQVPAVVRHELKHVLQQFQEGALH